MLSHNKENASTMAGVLNKGYGYSYIYSVADNKNYLLHSLN